MRLNQFEKFIITNGIRNFIQSHIETAKLAKLSPTTEFENVLEIGAADGNGAQSIDKHFNVKNIFGYELDENLLSIAKSRLTKTPQVQEKAYFTIGDAASLAFPDNSFDAAFSYGVLHHIPNWQEAVKDIARVSKKGSVFFIEEFYKALICHRFVQFFIKHPQSNRFNHQELLNVLEAEGYEIIHQGHFFNLSGRIIARKK